MEARYAASIGPALAGVRPPLTRLLQWVISSRLIQTWRVLVLVVYNLSDKYCDRDGSVVPCVKSKITTDEYDADITATGPSPVKSLTCDKVGSLRSSEALARPHSAITR